MTNMLVDSTSNDGWLVNSGLPDPAARPGQRVGLGMALSMALTLAACSERPSTDAPDIPAAAADVAVLDQPVEEVPPATAPLGTVMPSDDDVSTLQDDARFDGYGDVRFGMNEAQVREVWAGDLNGGEDERGVGDGGCFHLSPVDQPSTAYFAMMFEDGSFARYSTTSDDITAPGGGRLGMDSEEIEALYPGRVEQRPHKYVDDAKYLRIKQPDGNGIIVFATDAEGVVTEWRVGVAPQVDYVEGCA